jgi:hypothetical protein
VSIRKLLVASIVFASAVATAQTPRYSATLSQPVDGRKEVVANSNIWRCTGATCTLVSDPHDAASVRSCHALEKQVGSLTAYGLQGSEFDQDKLGKCNGSG